MYARGSGQGVRRWRPGVRDPLGRPHCPGDTLAFRSHASIHRQRTSNGQPCARRARPSTMLILALDRITSQGKAATAGSSECKTSPGNYRVGIIYGWGACSDATPTTHGRLGASLGAQNSGRAENIPPEIEGRYFRPTRPVLLQTPFACLELRWADPDGCAGAGHLIKPRTAREQASTLVACWPVPPPPATTLTLASTEAIVSLSPARPGMDAVHPWCGHGGRRTERAGNEGQTVLTFDRLKDRDSD